MTELQNNSTQSATLAELDHLAPGAPLLALGQTVFWDEPIKIGILQQLRKLGFQRELIAGIHDTDYFAKLSNIKKFQGYEAMPHNDTTTRDLWSAAVEFSLFFGSETVITKHIYKSFHLNLHRLEAYLPGILDLKTEAWGWRGIMGSAQEPLVISQTSIHQIFPIIKKTFQWALDSSVEMLLEPYQSQAKKVAAEIIQAIQGKENLVSNLTLSEYDQSILPLFHSFFAGDDLKAKITSTTQLFKFNKKTVFLPRFYLLNLFINPSTRENAQKAYNFAVEDSEVYELSRFGAGAIPFDLVIPDKGRGTIRLLPSQLIITTPEVISIKLEKPVTKIEELANIIEENFGENTVLVGKAIPLIGMLAHEFVCIFHQGASSYVAESKKFHQNLYQVGIKLNLNPILRVQYKTWDALEDIDVSFSLPKPFQKGFGTEKISAKKFAISWKKVVEEQKNLLKQLQENRCIEKFISFLATYQPEVWDEKFQVYKKLSDQIEKTGEFLKQFKENKYEIVQNIHRIKKERVELERKKGEHWRDFIFQKEPTQKDLKSRENIAEKINLLSEESLELEKKWRIIHQKQQDLLEKKEVKFNFSQKRKLEIEADLERIDLIRNAFILTEGLKKAGHRPSSWWFPLISPDGKWFNKTMETAEYSLESLI